MTPPGITRDELHATETRLSAGLADQRDQQRDLEDRVNTLYERFAGIDTLLQGVLMRVEQVGVERADLLRQITAITHRPGALAQWRPSLSDLKWLLGIVLGAIMAGSSLTVWILKLTGALHSTP